MGSGEPETRRLTESVLQKLLGVHTAGHAHPQQWSRALLDEVASERTFCSLPSGAARARENGAEAEKQGPVLLSSCKSVISQD